MLVKTRIYVIDFDSIQLGATSEFKVCGSNVHDHDKYSSLTGPDNKTLLAAIDKALKVKP